MCKGLVNKTFIIIFAMFVYRVCLSHAIDEKSIVKKIAMISAKSNIVVGVTAIHIEKNETLSFNGKLPFIMGSTVKLPIAVATLSHVDSKENDLDQLILLNKQNLVPGSGNLYQSFRNNRLIISLRSLLHRMMTKSDNTATDAVLKTINGPKAVYVRLQSLGFNHIKIDRTIMELFIATNDVGHISSGKPSELRRWESFFNKIPLGRKTTAWKLFQNDSRDTTTSNDMALLLSHLYQNKLTSPANTRYLLSLMEKCETGKKRIKGLLPPNTQVAHKTGTWAIYSKKFIRYPGSKNLYRFAGDVGIITLPQNKGHIAIAIYVKSTDVNNTSREKVIAQVAREIFDYYNQ